MMGSVFHLYSFLESIGPNYECCKLNSATSNSDLIYVTEILKWSLMSNHRDGFSTPGILKTLTKCNFLPCSHRLAT